MLDRAAFALALALALPLAGCDAVEAEPSGELRLRPAPSGGIRYDTNVLGDLAFEVLCLGPKILGHCVTMEMLKVDVSGFLTVVDDEDEESGDDLIGWRWFFKIDSDGDGVADSAASAEIVAREVASVAGGRAVELFDLRVDPESVSGPLAEKIASGSEPFPLCPPDPVRGGKTQAVLLADLEVDDGDGSVSVAPGARGVACTSGAIGRAMTLGYLPSVVGAPGFEAALRAIRADYCGDGESHAGAGSVALLADVWGIRGAFGSAPEARWSDAGALCLSHARDDDADAAAIRQACGIPTCAPGALGSQGELLVSSLP